MCEAHEGFRPLIQQRRITLKKLKEPVVRITDKIIDNGKRGAIFRLRLHPDVEVESQDTLRRVPIFHFKALSWVVGLDLYIFAVKK